MSQSPTAQLCYGISFPDEDHIFPWNKEEDGDLEGWWRELNGYSTSYPDDWKDRAAVKAYREEVAAFDLAHPCPVEEVTHCYYEYPFYILAVPGSLKMAYCGDTTVVDPATLTVDPEKVAALHDFCTKHGIEISEDSNEGWLLSTIYG